MNITPVAQTPVVTGSNSQNTNSNKTITPLFDASRNTEALDKDLQEIVLMLQNSDLSTMAQVLILDVLRTLSTIRKQQQQNAHSEALISLKFGLQAAEKQRKAAQSHFTADIVNSTASMAQAGIELGSQAIGAYQANKGMANINRQADGMDFSDAPAANPNAAPARPAGAPPVYTEKDVLAPETAVMTDKDGMPTMTPQATPNSAAAKAVEAGAGPSDDPLPTPRGAQNNTRRQEWITTAARNMYFKLDMRNHSLQAMGTMTSSAAKIGAGAETKDAGDAQAEATIAQALERYFQNREQFENSFGQDMKQAFAQAIEFVKQAEQARHQSAQTIANI